MACRTLLRRRSQLALLSSACNHQAPAVVRLRRQRAIAGDARLVALQRDAVVLAWNGSPAAALEVAGRPVEVRFRHGDGHYVFYALSQGSQRRESESGSPQAALRLSLPLRLEPARRREQTRLSLTGVAPIVARLTHVIDARREFAARLTDIGEGGVGVRARLGDIGHVHTGDLFWLEASEPGDKAHCEFVVRLVHLRPLRNSDHVALGWAFQPSDDVDSHEKNLRNLEALVARRRAASSPGGTR